ncbi:hypothetical protein GGQ68_003590 [Sagittula marina]|uniref:Transposase DDE domain-containing protein n=1 Tax=Sagittula marina TaxID=943940 RepID=A0A7W6GVE5_9RHOB|nr:hypothetical protein [Sagittula marina]
MLFAHLKWIRCLNRLPFLGPCDANDDFLLAATARNLRKLAKILPAPQQPRTTRQESLSCPTQATKFRARERVCFPRNR